MISRIFGAIVGYREISVEGDDRASFLNLIERLKVRIFNSRFAGERFKARLTNGEAKRLFAACEADGIAAEMSALHGVAGLIYRHRRRYGFFFGAAAMIAATFFSRYFIWDVEVVGNERVPASEIVAGLDALGVRPGAYIPSLDFELVANDFLLASDDVAWISVNMRSSLAVAEVLERKKPYAVPYAERNGDGAANLVASEDCEIVLPEVTAGKCVVAPGAVVRKGEILATGEIKLRNDKLRYEHAAGRVLAKVCRNISAAVPLSGEKKVFTGETIERKTVKIFGKSKNLFRNGGNTYDKYDTIISEHRVYAFDTVALPVTVRTEVLREYRLEPYTRTLDEAAALAEASCRAQLDAMLADAELASIEREDDFDGERYLLTERIYLIKDVAEEADLPAKEQEDEKTDDTKNHND